MESIFSNETEKKLELNEFSLEHLKETAKWGKFLAIIQFVTIALFILLALVLGIVLPELNNAMMQANPQLGSGFFVIFYLVLSAVMIFPSLKLYHYSIKLKFAIKEKDSELLMDAFKNQRHLYTFSGILTLIAIGINAMVLTLAFFSGMMSGL